MAGGQVIVVPTDPWKNDQWSQNDTINDGYPYVTDAGVAEDYSPIGTATVWTIRPGAMYGYPYIRATGAPPMRISITGKRYTQIPADTFQSFQIGAGILLSDFDPETGAYQRDNIIGATTGGVNFSANPEYSDYGEDIDNIQHNTRQLKKLQSYQPTLTGTFVTLSLAVAKKLAPGAVLDSTNKIRLIPRTKLEDTEFQSLWLVGDYSLGKKWQTTGFIAVCIKNGLSTGGFRMKSAKNGKGNFEFEFMGHYDLAHENAAPFELYIRQSLS